MKTKDLFGTLIFFLSMFSLMSCNKEDTGFSDSEIKQALFDMKGTYHGTAKIAYYQGSTITELQNSTATSRDSLKFSMSLLPISGLVADKSLAERLKEIGEVPVMVGYEFDQRDETFISFGLHPKDVVVWGGASPTLKIVFAKNYGGNAQVDRNFMMFNISPIELWMNGSKYEEFPPLVYHFSGEYQ